jgi:hypothetical protein
MSASPFRLLALSGISLRRHLHFPRLYDLTILSSHLYAFEYERRHDKLRIIAPRIINHQTGDYSSA